MSMSFCVGYLSFGVTESQFCRATVSYGTVAPVSEMNCTCPTRFQGFASAASAPLDREPVMATPRSVRTHVPDEWPAFVNGRLSGVMAGKRPPASPSSSL